MIDGYSTVIHTFCLQEKEKYISESMRINDTLSSEFIFKYQEPDGPCDRMHIIKY